MTAFTGRPEQVMLPRAPEEPARHPFPVLASLAPVVGAVLVWAITSSPFALVFAVLGPVIAVASLGDSRLQARRRRRQEAERLMQESLAASDAIDAAHAKERSRLERATPGALAITAGTRGAARWRVDLSDAVSVTVGRGPIPSSVAIEGDRAAFPELADAAGVLEDAPVAVDSRAGIGIHGTAPTRRAALRSIALQLAAALSPDSTTVHITDFDESWLERLPHRVVRQPGQGTVIEFRSGTGQRIILAEADRIEGITRDCAVELWLNGAVAAVTVEGATAEACRPELVSLEQAGSCASTLHELGSSLAVLPADPPERVKFTDLTQPSGESATLAARFCVAATGALELDLVRDGPHAIVGGTTGSGKSELLVSWLLAMAVRRAPAELSMLLVDFKGGASFAPIAGLPHVVGLVTDLDQRSAARALASLEAEVIRRERVLADAGVRDIAGLSSPDVLPRLVIAIDEFAAVQEGFDDLHRVVGDLASRGRSLGIHLVLCTQRPGGVIRDSVFANVRLRLSLAVTNAADSSAVIGSPAAARLAGTPTGRVLVSLDGSEPTAAQVALASRSDVQEVERRWKNAPRARRPWCDDLPRMLPLDELREAEPGAFALADLPHEQKQEPAMWCAPTDGNLLVLGATGAGRSSALHALCAATGGRLLPDDAEGAWDAAIAVVDSVRRGVGVGVVAVDDLDVLVARLGSEHGSAFIDLLVEFARIGPTSGSFLAVAARRLASALQPVAGVCESRLLLRMPDRHEYAIAGGDPSRFSVDAPPGRAEWHGRTVQVGFCDRPIGRVAVPEPVPLSPDTHPLIAVVTRRTAAVGNALSVDYTLRDVESSPRTGAEDSGAAAIIADPDAWQAAWAAVAALRPRASFLFHGCTTAEFRAISGSRALPPPVLPGSDSAWLLEPEGTVRRAVMPRRARPPVAAGVANVP